MIISFNQVKRKMKNYLILPILLFSSILGFSQITITALTSSPTSCSNNGSVTITITGGNPVFCYRINGGACQYSGSRTHTFTGLYSGNYTVTVEDGQSSESQSVSVGGNYTCLLYTSPSPRDATLSRMPSSA